MSLVELPELREHRSDESEVFKLINMVRRRVNAGLGEPALLDVASVSGFADAPAMHGAPVGTPDPVQQDRIPWVVDTLNLKVWFWIGAAWHFVALT